VRLNPSDTEAHARLSIAYRKLRMLPEAKESLKHSVRLRPEPRVHVLLAFTYVDSGRHRDAIPLLTEQRDSVKSVVGQRLVECYLAIGDNENALPIVQKLRQLTPDDPNVLYVSSKGSLLH
jgi:Flp pilus assembly protein TadD